MIEFAQEDVSRLLSELGSRLSDRGVAATVYVVGGAAIALTLSAGRRTADIDALVSDRVVIEEAQAMASEEGLPPNWLNSNAAPWVPPAAIEVRKEPGLTVQTASPEHLLAMKIVAARARDQDDILQLASHLGLQDADAYTLARLLTDVYGLDGLGEVLDVGDTAVTASQGVADMLMRSRNEPR